MQTGEGDAPGFDAHPTAQYDRIEPPSPEVFGESLDVRCPLGEHEAMPAAFQRRRHVADHLSGPGIVGDEIPVDGGHPTWYRRVGLAGVAKSGVVHVQHGHWSRRGVGLREFQLR
ncbi:MAG: hypothetical protein H0V41_11160 [Pseudonocardiales bacterium]|nr:hypothetical protein [Pseudonocardiales bacterium]